MAGTGRLSIYDMTDWLSVSTDSHRSADYHIGAESIVSLRVGLDLALKNKMKFKRVVFETHGGAGRIRFGKDRIWASTWSKEFSGRGYENLFPFYSKMYFSGCNISDDEDGWAFLEEANKLFFAGMGGVSMAYTSTGFALGWSMTPKHFWGELRLVIQEPGKGLRRVAGGKLVQDMLSGKGDEAAIYALTEL
jgi:hypothetical protein